MSELRTQDQILADVGINVETFKEDKELLYICIRRAMDDFAEQYHNWKISKANGVEQSSEPALHKHIVSRCFSSESELRLHIEKSIPIAIKPTRKSKTTFICPFTSYKAKEAVVESIVESLLNNG